MIFGRGGRKLSEEDVDLILDSEGARHVDEMLRWTGVGTADEVAGFLVGFAEHTRADELIVAGAGRDREARLRSFELVAEAHGLAVD